MKYCEIAGCTNRARVQNKGTRGRMCETHHRLKYPKRSAYKHRRKATVRKSVRKIHFRDKYGLTLEARDKLIALQDGNCAICGDKVDVLAVDHCHKTGSVRGMLCTKCNSGLGLFNDDIDLLASAVSYLINSRLKETG